MVDIDHSKYQFEKITEEARGQQPFYRLNYERTFHGTHLARRVLAFITDEVDSAAGGVPRNTEEAVARVLIGDGEVVDDVAPPGPEDSPEALFKVVKSARVKISEVFSALVEEGFISQRDNGSYEKTEAGWVEVSN